MLRSHLGNYLERLEDRRLLSTVQIAYASGDAVPGLPGAVFDSFDDASSIASVFNNHGDLAFSAWISTGSGNGRRLTHDLFSTNASGALVPILTLGTAAPGVAGKTITEATDLILTDDRDLVFKARLQTAGQGYAGTVIYEWGTNGKFTILASLGSGLPGNVFSWFTFSANASGFVVLSGNDGVAEIDPTGKIVARAAVGAAAPGGGTYANDFSPAAINNSGQIAFYASNLYKGDGHGGFVEVAPGFFPDGLAPGLNDKGDVLYFNQNGDNAIHVAQTNGIVRLVAKPGTAVPGTTSKFQSLFSPVLAPDGSVAFTAAISTGTSGVSSGIWVAGAGGALHDVVNIGDPSPLGDGSKFISLADLEINASDQIVFDAATTKTAGAFGTGGSAEKLVAIAVTGEKLPVHAGISDSISSFVRIVPELNNAGQVFLDALGNRQYLILCRAAPPAGPDLSVKFSSPVASTATADGALLPKFQISNIGTAAASGQEMTRYYLSTTPTLGASAILIGTQTQSLQLQPGTSIIQAPTLTVPSSIRGGTYYFIAVANSNGAIVELDSANDINDRAVSGPIQITARPDISGAFSDSTNFHKFWNAGGKESFTLGVTNIGGGTENKTIGVDFYLSASTSLNRAVAKQLASTSIALNLAPGQSLQAKVVTSIVIPANTALGTYYLIADLDPKHVSVEGNPANNTVTSDPLCLCSATALNATQASLYDTAIQKAKAHPAPAVNFGANLVALDAAATKEIEIHESFVPFPYLDSLGLPTIGYGTRISANATALTALHLNVAQLTQDAKANGTVTSFKTIAGVLTGVSCSGRGTNPLEPAAISVIYATSLLSTYEKTVRAAISSGLAAKGVKMAALPGNAQVAMIDMAYNVGTTGFFKFARFVADIEAAPHPDYGCAGYEMFQSLWATQVKTRAIDDYVLLISAISPALI
ncbi:MAG TPA: choice-of-anchor tandem repeat NxxGxxAF-containing protein [Humisphaera sp.]|nr:choice-of-anchor tandem repeat NxxGxxAF-containing protein [Humisphaera sp.]